MRKILKKIFIIVLCCMFVVGGTGCLDLDDSLSGTGSTNSYEIVGTPTMNVEYSEYLGYSAEISGVLKNTSKRDWSYCQVEFAIYDSNDYNLGTALDNINNLRSGDSWNFNASLFSFPETKPYKWVLIDVSYF